MRMRELFNYKNFKLIEERDDDGDRYFYYHHVLKDNKYTEHKADIGYNHIKDSHFKKLVDMGFPTRDKVPKTGPMTCDDIDDLWQRHINNIADNILLGD